MLLPLQDPKIIVYDNESFPSKLQAEIEIVLRTEWPIKPEEKSIKPDWDITHHIVLLDSRTFLSYGAVVHKLLSHASQEYKIIGMSGIITRPEHRGRGYGRKVISTATDIIRNSDADLALFNTAQVGLYEKFGFELLPDAKILKGPMNHPTVYPEDVFALFLSPKAKEHRKDFESIPIYFGETVW